MYCVNEFTVRLLLITVLLNLRKITDIVRKFYQNWIELENGDPRFHLVCGCCKSKDTPANDETEGRMTRHAFTQVDLPGSLPRRRRGRRSQKYTCQLQNFATESVAVTRSDFPRPPLPVQNFGPAVYTTWQPPNFAMGRVAAARLRFPPPTLPIQNFGPAVYTTWQPAQPPRMVRVPAPRFGFPRPPPPPTYYVDPVHCRTSV
ncbi:uncharacterized protein LOC132947074 [Metopolophium dirhodum]|uniref:uncharacterized protein LOC132947074 n=1 Tax=Metopolophium dirhodum TaxID=44670 RepID=UPI00298FF7C6|nr:uncharacterized protein LOC132947074 [Metopolophium dirhodum]